MRLTWVVLLILVICIVVDDAQGRRRRRNRRRGRGVWEESRRGRGIRVRGRRRGRGRGNNWPIDGNWGPWSNYDECSVTCDGGIQKRHRLCNNPAPKNRGRRCNGRKREKRYCNQVPCPVDGMWGGWSHYGDCSVTCGGGTMFKSRSCDHPKPANGGADCLGNETEIMDCNTDHCPVDGNWGPWSNYSECSVTCGWGIQKRYRECNDPAPAHGGHDCRGRRKEKQYCYTEDCLEPVLELCLDDECGNHGVYVDGICNCNPGFAGSMCEIDLCGDNTCGNPDGCCRVRPVPESPDCGETCVGRQQLICIYRNCHAYVCNDKLSTCYEPCDINCVLSCSEPAEL
ncbi:semaphorin-5B [Patella vulgata]|uniref:semaphorin-5B n=1 Tax=Patella vulgata TaxID=6465 RepID=UPI00217F9753|nr:semaphorin-5B [Patella vulgata]